MIRFVNREWVAYPIPAYSNKIMVTALLCLLRNSYLPPDLTFGFWTSLDT
jgi:hypothetical protein